jgi:hypothetical protein
MIRGNPAGFGLQVFPSVTYSVRSRSFNSSIWVSGEGGEGGSHVEIDLGKGHAAVIDDQDAALIAGFKWYPMKTKEGKVYAAGWKHVPPGRFFVHLHRLIANAQPGEIIDHVDRDPELPEK